MADLQNPSQIPAPDVQPQTRVDALGHTVSGLPGLPNICANPVPSCTTAPCGCTASDFANIVSQDLLVGSAQTTPPSQVNGSRFVFVDSQTLTGPLCTGCNQNANSFTENDGMVTSTTETTTNSYSVGYNVTSGFSLFGAGFSLETSKAFTWTTSMSSGSSNGQNHTADVNLETSSVDCNETVNIYEDTVYHTFAFSVPVTPPATCN